MLQDYLIKFPSVRKKNDKQFVMGISIDSDVKVSKLATLNTTLICVTRMMIWAKMNLNHHFDNLSYMLGI